VIIGPAEMRRIARLHGFRLISVDDSRGSLYGIIAGRIAAKHDLKKRLPTRRS
jgi:hypothetical protein